MKTTIETINGKLCTVIRKPFDAEWVRGQIEMEENPTFILKGCFYKFSHYTTYDSRVVYHAFNEVSGWSAVDLKEAVICKYLPALPKNPKSKDELLIFRYYSEGLEPVLTDKGENYSYLWVRPNKAEITHAIHAETGERVEIAIEEAK